MLEGNKLIRASAGTGKTYSLATRYIRLMLIGKVEPEKFIALTFSRAAAQEIYTKILERLWKAAESEENAAKESVELCKGLGGVNQTWTRQDFASSLRRLINTQHLGTIATLDSFILRMVRNFPLEMGFQHAVEVLDPANEDESVKDALRAILQGTGKSEDFIKVFTKAREGKLPRVLEYKIASMLKTWHNFYVARPECRSWDVASMCQALGVPETSECPDLSGLPFCQIQRKNAVSYEEKFAELCRTYDGTAGVFDVADGVKDLMLHFLHNPEADSYEYDYYKKHYVFACGKDGAEKIRAAVRHMFNLYIRKRLAAVRAKLDFVAFVEDEYNRNSRLKGKLTFNDFTRISAAKEGSEKSFDMQNLEYRFDEKFEHWALDEFQDTSEAQWTCLKNLVQSAAEGGGRTVMTVGDLKQSIYTWRGGDDTPFKEMMGWGTFTGCIEDSCTSYRYEKNICDFINAVFGPKNLLSGILPTSCAEVLNERWLADNCWKEHLPDTDKKSGQPKANDFVRVIGVSDPDGEAEVETLLPTLAAEVKRIWQEHEERSSTETVGILVRRNEDGMAIAEYLRKKEIPVAWEGLSSVADVPVVNALVDLLRLAEHPEDTFAWQTVNELFPVCETLFSPPKEGELTAAYVSGQVARALSQQGLSRTLQAWCRTLSADSVGLDALSKLRLREMVGVAVAYEQRKASRFSIDGFEAFLAASSKREQGDSSRVVRILTIHRSKGLTLDRVVVPLPEGVTEGIVNPGSRGLLYVKEGKWVLPSMSAELAEMNPETAKAQKERQDERLLSSIRMYYVALTRARRAMYVILPLTARNAAEPFFRDAIASAFAGFARRKLEEGNEVVFEQGVEPQFKSPDAGDMGARGGGLSWSHDEPAEPIGRASPSSAEPHAPSSAVRSASGLFAENVGAAAKEGVKVHGQYEAIEWASGAELESMPEAFRVAFVKPSPEATVWRERSYEIYRELEGKGEWETGQFDRVVFSGEGSGRAAVIYDFKTNALKTGESRAAFERRMCQTYSPQMKAYRDAVGTLTGLPANSIRSVLLLQSTGSAIACDR